MTTLHFTQTTSATPDQLLAALTDFGPVPVGGLPEQRGRLPEGPRPR